MTGFRLWRVPGKQSRVFVLNGEDSLAKLLDELTVITLDRVEGQRRWEVWEFKHLYRLWRSFQS